MSLTCAFEFDRPEPVYYSGETINGRIKLNSTNYTSVRCVYILFQGEGKVRWEERETRTRDGKTEHYTEYYRAHQSFLHTRTDVFGEGTLPLGLHTYTFCIPLPLQCPTSCVEKYGKINYQLSLVVDRPYRFDNVFLQPMTVIRQLNLNLSSEYLFPIQAEDIKYFCCWCCSSGPVLSTLSVPFCGYAPGQAIKYKLEIHNEAMGQNVNGFKLRLQQVYTFTAHMPRHKTRTITNTLGQFSSIERVLPLSKRAFEGQLIIPPVPPTLPNCIITIQYILKAEIDCGSCHRNSEITVPITIGTTPLMQSANNPGHGVMIPPSAPNMPPSYAMCAPPSFEEATTFTGKFIDTDVDQHNRNDDFIPKYPMYTNFAMPSAPPTVDGALSLLATQKNAQSAATNYGAC